MKLDDEIEGRWLDPVFEEGEDLVGELNEDRGFSLRLLENLEEECQGEWFVLKDVSFNAGRNLETDEEVWSCEFLLSSSVLEFEDPSLTT